MKWLPEFRTETPVSHTDKTDKSTFLESRVTKDKSICPQTALPIPDKTDKSQETASEAKARLLAADIRVALLITETDAGMEITSYRIVQGESESRRAWREGALVFDMDEMFVYIDLSSEERKLFHKLKMRGWKPIPKKPTLEARLLTAGISIVFDADTANPYLVFSDAERERIEHTILPFEVELTDSQRRELTASLDYFERLVRGQARERYSAEDAPNSPFDREGTNEP
jgi:hypothetical protein